jgi:hypothetical protein
MVEGHKSQAEKAVAWLNEKWGNHRACPYCTNDVWQVDSTLVRIQPIHSRVAGLAYVAFMVICDNCGHTVLVNAVAAGLVPGES